jgi:hypothetical protein
MRTGTSTVAAIIYKSTGTIVQYFSSAAPILLHSTGTLD